MFPNVGTDSPRIWLSCVPDGEKVDLWNKNDGSGRQEWVLSPIDMEVVSVSIDVDNYKAWGHV